MPGKPIEIQLSVVSTDAERGLERTSDAMDDLATSTEKVEDSSKDAARVIDRDLTGALDDVKRKAKTAGDALGDDMHRGARKAGDATDEFKDEAKQNFSEVASSFSGDMDGAIDLVQGTLGGLAGSIPGVGLALGALGAGAGAFYTQWQEKTEATKEDVARMYDDMLVSGASYLSDEYQQELYWEILKGESRLLNARNLQAIAGAASATDAEVAMAYAGNVEMMRKVTDGLIERRAIFQAQLADETDLNDSAAQSGLGYVDGMLAGIEQRRATIEEETSTILRQRDAWDEAHDTANEGMTATETAADRALSKISGTAQAIRDMPASASIAVDVDLARAERTLRNWNPIIQAGVRFGTKVV